MEARVTRLVDAVRSLSQARSHDQVQTIVKATARSIAGADGATFVLKDRNCCHYVDEDAISPLWKGKRFPLETCITGWVMLNRQPTSIEDIYQDSRIPHDAYRPTFVRSLTAMPIRSQEPIGAIGVYWANQHRTTPDELGLLGALADSTALAMENVATQAGLEGQVQERTADLHRRNAELRRAAERMEAVEKVVKVCSWTRRVQLDGRWVSFEEWLERRLDVQVTHGMSEEAMIALLREIKDNSRDLGNGGLDGA